MWRWLFLLLFLALSFSMWAQTQDAPSDQLPANPAPQADAGNPAPANSSSTNNSKPSNPAPTANSNPGNSAPANSDAPAKPVKPFVPDFSPPRSDRVNADDLPSDAGESSSKDTQVDFSPPENDERAHPKSAEALGAATAAASAGVSEFHIWDPHKAAKSVEIGDFYFKRKNYRAAEDRYREALVYKDNDAVATFRLAECLEKLNRSDDARTEYESYLRILPHGPQADAAEKAIERFKAQASVQSK